jgi:hypothetical protein
VNSHDSTCPTSLSNKFLLWVYIHIFPLAEGKFLSRCKNLPLFYVYIRRLVYIELAIFRFSRILLFRATCTITCKTESQRSFDRVIPKPFLFRVVLSAPLPALNLYNLLILLVREVPKLFSVLIRILMFNVSFTSMYSGL